MGLRTLTTKAYTIIIDDQGRWIWAFGKGTPVATAYTYAAEPQPGSKWLDTDDYLEYTFVSGAWTLNKTMGSGVLTAASLTGNLTGDVTGDVTGDIKDTSTWGLNAFGPSFLPYVKVEEIDMGGEDENAAKNSAANMILANSVIFGITKYVTESFTGDMANYDIGDESTPTRFVTNSTQKTLADADFHNEDGIVLDLAASDIEVLLDDAATAGKLRIAVYGIQFTIPTS